MSLRFGTCSWKFPSWMGLVYSREHHYAADYLPEYAEHFSTAEIDSWFYHMPTAEEVAEYKARVPDTFRFTCKVPRDLTLTHHRDFGRGKSGGGKPVGGRGSSQNRQSGKPTRTGPPNEQFLSLKLFEQFAEITSPLHNQIDAMMFQFEYLNQQKMSSVGEFIDRFGTFIKDVDPGLPVGLEIRNGNYLKEEYFRFLSAAGLIPVLPEKQYMPPVTEVFQKFKPLVGERLVFRLMGGDRKEIEAAAGGKWNQLVMKKANLQEIATVLAEASLQARTTVNVNNHFEGSAPLTIQRLQRAIESSGAAR